MSEEVQASNGTSLTIKGGAGYEMPWFVIRAGSVEAVMGEVQFLDSNPEALDMVATVSAKFVGSCIEAGLGTPAAAPAQGGAQAPAQQGGAFAPPPCKKDNCGKPLVYESWTNKDGSKSYGPAWRCESRQFGHDVDWKLDQNGQPKPPRR